MTRVLVAYATKHQSTREIAEGIAIPLREAGNDVECADAASASAKGYDAVVLGSAVYMGRWRKSARAFLDRERETLATVPFWIFSSGPAGADAADPVTEDRWLEPRAVVERSTRLGVRGHIVFGGRLPVEPGNLIERAMVRGAPPESIDLRDWEEIERWSRGIAADLAGDRLGA